MARDASPAIWQLGSVKADGSRNALHPADVRGRYLARRRALYAALIAFYVALPLVPVGGHPAVHLDVAARRFYLFGQTFNAQDLWLLLLVLTTAGFALLFVTAWLGRVWCGYACPQTVFLEGVYRRVERWVDGPRERRLKAQGAPWTAGRLAREGVKHGLYLAISWALAHVALAFFVSYAELRAMVVEGPAAHLTLFLWSMGVTGALYLNFAWFREQLCIAVCPYGRLQSAMTDRDSLIIGYDARRGEPRGRALPRAPSQARAAGEAIAARLSAAASSGLDTAASAPASAPARGDCVDCARCVVVCPTGIDIRHGLQMECIGCAQCVDACDEVMGKLGRPAGLIRYDSLRGLAGEGRRVVRPRLLAYGALLLTSTAALGAGLVTRTPFEANLLRRQGAPYGLDGALVRNQLELHLVNKNPGPTTFAVSVESPVPAQVVLPAPEVSVGSLESTHVPILVALERGHLSRPVLLTVRVRDAASGEVREVQTRFVGPPPGTR
jgi:polyferredoxin